ncbi:MAG: V-type ATP synthase subunit I, partial [Methanomassiliicoccaceae archaeon]|nr:V-type ATP synthase subunit I [Methanomassiliicoccaceae archaeon]
MSRIVIVGSKARLDDAIETLYSLKLIHLIDHTVGSDEGFSIGAPRPYSEKASERLLSLKAMEKELDINIEAEMDDKVSADDVRSKISSNCVESIGKEVFKVLDRKNGIVQRIAEENARKSELSLIAGMPVDLDLYRGYGSIAVVVGSVKTDPTAALAGLVNSEFFITEDKKVMALFVKKSDKENAMRILTEFEFAEMSVPEGSGPIDENIKECDSKIATLSEELGSVEQEIAALKEKHGKNIITMDEEISFEAQKGETPLRIAVSDYSYVIDAWVPTAKVGTVASAMEKELGNSAYVELQEDRTRNLHEEEHAEERFKSTPTKMKNGPYAKNFEYPVQLVATPRYQEIDPSVIFSIFFPLFFGFMV